MNAATEREVASFESHRGALTGLAYRMLGSRAEAEDVVQDAYLRWHEADHDAIEEPRRYLGTIVTRLCLDRMKSARARREVYVGQWLPEPVVDETLDADTAGDIAHDLSVALMLVLERLSPARVFCCTTFSAWTLPKWRARCSAAKRLAGSLRRGLVRISRRRVRVFRLRAKRARVWLPHSPLPPKRAMSRR
jgi:hypothetical protein